MTALSVTSFLGPAASPSQTTRPARGMRVAIAGSGHDGGQPDRRGRVLDVLAPDGAILVVRWDDGRTTYSVASAVRPIPETSSPCPRPR